MTGLLSRFLRRWRQAGAVVVVDPRAEREWLRVLEERRRRQEAAELDELQRALERVSRWW